MTAESWTRLRAVFERAVDLPHAERAALLEDALEGPDRERVERMLAAEERADGFLEPPTPADLPALHEPPPAERIGTRIGAFTLRSLIASGGMGAVYEAEQEEPRRRVALKVMRAGLTSPGAQRRFRDEADLLARLRHPGIAHVYEAGIHVAGAMTSDGARPVETPWFAMELVEGARPITGYARAMGLDVRARVRLLREVCAAVLHGHQRGIVHRDLKPWNLLVDRDGHVKVIDFGVAKAIDAKLDARSGETLPGDVVGTLLFMSPEQVEGRQADVDTRSDVYALGVVLYELVCDRPPFDLDGLGLTRAARLVCEEDPPPPSRVVPGVPRDLDWILARAMAKERERRYPSVSDLSEDLGRFLADEPVLAGPPGAGYRARKFARRHRAGVAAGAAVLLAVLAGLVGTSLGMWRAVRAEDEAQEERRAALAEAAKATAVVDFLVDVLAAPDPRRAGREVRVADVLELAEQRYGERFASAPDVRARLASALGVVYGGLGLEEQSAQQLELALATLRELDDGPQADVVDALLLLGRQHLIGGRLDDVERVLDEARAQQDALLAAAGEPGAGSIARSARLSIATGRLRLAQRRFDEAEPALREGLAGIERALGPGHRDALVARNELAGLLHEAGRLDEAEPLYREALAGLAALSGDEHPDTVRLRFNYAMLLHTRGKSEPAIAQMREILAVRERTLGPDHPDTLAVLANLGGMELLLGNLEEADALCREVLARAPDDPAHPLTQAMKVNLGNVRYRLGDFAEAEALWGDVWEQRAATFGPEHQRTLEPLFDLARAARGLEEYETALERARRGLEASRRTLGERHHFTFEYERELGRTLVLLGRFEEAEEVLLACLDLHRELADEVDGLQGPEPQLVALYEAWGRPADAAPYRASGSTGEAPN